MAGSAKRVERGSRRDAASKLAEQRLSVLELARELGNVAEALISNIAMFGGEGGATLDKLTSYADGHGIQAPPPPAPSA